MKLFVSALALSLSMTSICFASDKLKEDKHAEAKDASGADTKQAETAKSAAPLVSNAPNDAGFPLKFRIMNDIREKGKNINWEGLADVPMSGSAQYSERELETIHTFIPKGKKVFLVDLRQESHGFFDGVAASWFAEGDAINKGLTHEQVVTVESQLLNQVLKEPETALSVRLRWEEYTEDTKMLDIIHDRTIHPKEVLSEEAMAKKQGVNYFRVTVTDGFPPTDEQVDQFITFVKGLPAEAWLHFHCFDGHGRTTTFMSLFDMIHNAQKVALKDILERQKAIGGADLLDISEAKGPKLVAVKQRLELLQNFHHYILETKGTMQPLWSEWVKTASQKKETPKKKKK